MTEPANRIAIIGGGFSGLSAALRISASAPEVDLGLFEASDGWGGVVRTTRRNGYLVEHGADMFTAREPWAIDLCRRIGFADQLIETDRRFRRAFIVHRGRLSAVPDGFTLMRPTRVWPLATTSLLSWKGKLRVGWEYFVPRRRSTEDESLADFARRRLGREAYERLVQPLIGGIFTADPERLSMQAALPQFVQMEREQGGLIRGALRTPPEHGQLSPAQESAARESGARYGSFRAPRDGMQSLIAAIAGQLPEGTAQLQQRVTRVLCPKPGRWLLKLGDGSETGNYDGLIVALPAHRAAEVVRELHSPLAVELSQIEYAGVAVVSLGYRRDQIAHALDGFGCVAPLRENRQVLSISFASVKFPGRAPPGSVLLRVFIGGACQSELLERSDDELRRLAEQELQQLLGASGAPEICEVARWQRAMPQYHLGHLDRTRSIAKSVDELPGFQLAGNAFDGVGIPTCIRRAEQAADALLAELKGGCSGRRK